MNTSGLCSGDIDFGSLERIAVFRALQLGDLLCTVPALRLLRQAAPQAQITLIGLPWAREFAARFACYVDDFMEFPGFPGLPESAPRVERLPEFFSQAQARRFDLALQLHGSGALSNPLAVALGAARNAGFYVPGQYCPDLDCFTEWVEDEHEVLRYLRLLRFLSIPAPGEPPYTALEFPLQQADYQALEQAFAQVGHSLPAMGTFACIHPGARMPSRRWPAQRFARVAEGLMRQGWPVVLTGSKDERPIIDTVLADISAVDGMRPIDLCGQTSLGALAALVAGARLVVSNDTGMSHIAAATRTPSVIICSGADPKRWAPLNRQRHRLLFGVVSCRPCSHMVCPIGHPCATQIGIEQVLSEALGLCAANLVNPPLPGETRPATASRGENASERSAGQ